MEIILKEDIVNLGYKNDIVTVKSGYGRNYLIPTGKAVIASQLQYHFCSLSSLRLLSKLFPYLFLLIISSCQLQMEVTPSDVLF